MLPSYFPSHFSKIKWSNIFSKLIQTEVTLNKSDKNDKKKLKKKTLNIFKCQSVFIYILFFVVNLFYDNVFYTLLFFDCSILFFIIFFFFWKTQNESMLIHNKIFTNNFYKVSFCKWEQNYITKLHSKIT